MGFDFKGIFSGLHSNEDKMKNALRNRDTLAIRSLIDKVDLFSIRFEHSHGDEYEHADDISAPLRGRVLTPLIVAMLQKDEPLALAILSKYNADNNSYLDSNRNIFRYALENKLDRVVSKMIDLKLPAKKWRTSRDIADVLSAVFVHRPDLIMPMHQAQLLDLDEDVTYMGRDDVESSPLSFLADGLLGINVTEDHRDAIKYVAKFHLSQGKSIDITGGKENRTPAMFFAMAGDWRLLDFAREKGADMNAQDRHGNSILLQALGYGEDRSDYNARLNIVNRLLDWKVDLDAPNRDGITGLNALKNLPGKLYSPPQSEIKNELVAPALG